jgi:hypothetical protein
MRVAWIFGGVVLTSLLLAAVAGVWVYTGSERQLPTATPTTLAFTTPTPDTSTLTTLVLQEDGDERQLLVCRRGRCRLQTPPDSSDAAPVFDGSAWYRYRDEPVETTKKTKRILERINPGEAKGTVVVEETQLVKPRGLFISPNGQRIVYWLDNIDAPQKELTELWMYDALTGSTRVLVEKVIQPSVVSSVRWSRSSNHVWFVQKAGAGQTPTIRISAVQPVQELKAFAALDWKKLETVAVTGVMDISTTGSALAYVETEGATQRLLIATDKEQKPVVRTDKHLNYVEWVEDNSLVYAISDAGSTTFARFQDGKTATMATHPGLLQSARLDPANEWIVFAATNEQNRLSLYTVHLASGTVNVDSALPNISGERRIVKVDRDEARPSAVAGITTTFPDAELIAFIDKQLPAITQKPELKAARIITTNETNTLYVDYRLPDGTFERILITVRDILHPEWSLRSRYQHVQGEWVKAVGGGLKDPNGNRIYEWEDGVKQWILKG